MSKERAHIPRSVRDEVMSEFNHRCAKCGAVGPHLHHIDEDPANNESINLIPLCPNCHLTDQHNPTKSIAPERLRLFRHYKDPTILTPQFHPVFMRLRFLDAIEIPSDADAMKEHADKLRDQAWELELFVRALEMGAFYGPRVAKLLGYPQNQPSFTAPGEADYDFKVEYMPDAKAYLEQLRAMRQEVYDLIVELLRFQHWNVTE